MNECEICFRRTDLIVVKVRMTPSNYDSFFFSPNWYLKFIPNDSAPIRTKFSFRLNPFNGVKSFRMISRHSPFNSNDSAAHSNGLESERYGNRFRIHTESHGVIFIPNESETCIRDIRSCSMRVQHCAVNAHAVSAKSIRRTFRTLAGGYALNDSQAI